MCCRLVRRQQQLPTGRWHEEEGKEEHEKTLLNHTCMHHAHPMSNGIQQLGERKSFTGLLCLNIHTGSSRHTHAREATLLQAKQLGAAQPHNQPGAASTPVRSSRLPKHSSQTKVTQRRLLAQQSALDQVAGGASRCVTLLATPIG